MTALAIKHIMANIFLTYLRPAPVLFLTLVTSLLVPAVKLLPGANSTTPRSQFPVWRIGWADMLRPTLCTPA